MRLFGALAAAALGSPLVSGALIYVPGWLSATEGSYQRRVQEPVTVVAAALKEIGIDDLGRGEAMAGIDLDLPQILRADTPTGSVWQIVKDGKVTVEMTATLNAANGGAATDVVGAVKVIDGHEAVSAKAIELVFANALDAKLAEVGGHSGPDAGQSRGRNGSGDTGLGATAMLEDPMAMSRAALQAEMAQRRLEREMGQRRERDEATRGVNFRPGEPMVNVDSDRWRYGQ